MSTRSSLFRGMNLFVIRLGIVALAWASGGCAPAASVADSSTPSSDAASTHGSDAASRREASTADGAMCVPVGGDCTTNAQCCSGDCHEDHCD